VLHAIGADTIRQVLVINKIDAVPELAARGGAVERDEYGNISRVFLSARTGQGLETLRAAIAEIATAEHLSESDGLLSEGGPRAPAFHQDQRDDAGEDHREDRKILDTGTDPFQLH